MNKDDDMWLPENWAKANPLNLWSDDLNMDQEKIKRMAEKALEAKEKGDTELLNFMTKSLNIWVTYSAGSLLDIAKWKQCESDLTLEDMKGRECYLGIDLSQGGDRIIPLPLGFDIVPLDLKLTDSQFYELKKFSSLQVAAAFGIKPNHLNNYDKSSYSNSEMQNLTFYVDTLLAILTQWEEELNYKLLTNEEIEQGLSYQFNVGTILRGDIKTQSESLRNYVSGSIYTINEARKKAGLPPAPGGDVIVVNGSYTDLDKLGNAYAKGGE